MPKQHTANSFQEVIDRVTSNEDLLDILLDVEDYLDSSNIYAFRNWIKGAVVDGPYVSRYWVKLTLKWPYKKMPDPDGGLRLLAHGTKVVYRIAIEEVPKKIETPSDYQPGTKKPKMQKVKVWLVDLLIPRKFVENLSRELMDLYDEDADIDTVDDDDDTEDNAASLANNAGDANV